MLSGLISTIKENPITPQHRNKIKIGNVRLKIYQRTEHNGAHL
jgi:hypothetical protein